VVQRGQTPGTTERAATRKRKIQLTYFMEPQKLHQSGCQGLGLKRELRASSIGRKKKIKGDGKFFQGSGKKKVQKKAHAGRGA